ncbi:unnamed protein product [Trichogramma brassicae]|uniref:Uncharacterized protein n=1 Tax=Trichogramma brassicae TaxID=86971 RepID=A0A6H5IRS0_9HYME|nr:unnamed protein product [Trichogramma brassicae]
MSSIDSGTNRVVQKLFLHENFLCKMKEILAVVNCVVRLIESCRWSTPAFCTRSSSCLYSRWRTRAREFANAYTWAVMSKCRTQILECGAQTTEEEITSPRLVQVHSELGLLVRATPTYIYVYLYSRVRGCCSSAAARCVRVRAPVRNSKSGCLSSRAARAVGIHNCEVEERRYVPILLSAKNNSRGESGFSRPIPRRVHAVRCNDAKSCCSLSSGGGSCCDSETPPPLPSRKSLSTLSQSPPPLPPRPSPNNSLSSSINSSHMVFDQGRSYLTTATGSHNFFTQAATSSPLSGKHQRAKSSPEQLGNVSPAEASRRLIASESMGELAVGQSRTPTSPLTHQHSVGHHHQQQHHYHHQQHQHYHHRHSGIDLDDPCCGGSGFRTPPGTPPPPYPAPILADVSSSTLNEGITDNFTMTSSSRSMQSSLDAGTPGLGMIQQPIMSMEDDDMSDQEVAENNKVKIVYTNCNCVRSTSSSNTSLELACAAEQQVDSASSRVMKRVQERKTDEIWQKKREHACNASIGTAQRKQVKPKIKRVVSYGEYLGRSPAMLELQSPSNRGFLDSLKLSETDSPTQQQQQPEDEDSSPPDTPVCSSTPASSRQGRFGRSRILLNRKFKAKALRSTTAHRDKNSSSGSGSALSNAAVKGSSAIARVWDTIATVRWANRSPGSSVKRGGELIARLEKELKRDHADTTDSPAYAREDDRLKARRQRLYAEQRNFFHARNDVIDAFACLFLPFSLPKSAWASSSTGDHRGIGSASGCTGAAATSSATGSGSRSSIGGCGIGVIGSGVGCGAASANELRRISGFDHADSMDDPSSREDISEMKIFAQRSLSVRMAQGIAGKTSASVDETPSEDVNNLALPERRTRSESDCDGSGAFPGNSAGSSSNSSLSTRSLDSPSMSLEQVHPSASASWDSDVDVEADPPDWSQSVTEEVLASLSNTEKKRQEVINGE